MFVSPRCVNVRVFDLYLGRIAISSSFHNITLCPLGCFLLFFGNYNKKELIVPALDIIHLSLFLFLNLDGDEKFHTQNLLYTINQSISI